MTQPTIIARSYTADWRVGTETSVSVIDTTTRIVIQFATETKVIGESRVIDTSIRRLEIDRHEAVSLLSALGKTLSESNLV
jgi:low affinity Fe/Cu permease